MNNFKTWLENSGLPWIHWNMSRQQTWMDRDTGKTHFYRIEKRPLDSLKSHESPSDARIMKFVKLMNASTIIPLISIGEDGMILDGHARYYAAIKYLGTSKATVPVEIHVVK